MDFSQAFDVGRNLNHGVESLKRAALPLFTGAFLMQCTEGGGGGGNIQIPDPSIFEDMDWGSSSHDPDLLLRPLLQSGPLADMGMGFGEAGIVGLTLGILIGVILLGLVCGLAMFAFRAWLHGGYLRLQAHTLETGMGDFSALFSGKDLFLGMVGAKLLKAVIMLGLALVAAIPALALIIPGAIRSSELLIIGGIGLFVLFLLPLSVYFGLGLAFVEHVVTFEQLSPTAAIRRSLELADGNRLSLFFFMFVFGIFRLAAVLVGLMMLCIGVIFTLPLARAVADTAFTEGYLLLTRPRQETERWAIWGAAAAPAK